MNTACAFSLAILLGLAQVAQAGEGRWLDRSTAQPETQRRSQYVEERAPSAQKQQPAIAGKPHAGASQKSTRPLRTAQFASSTRSNYFTIYDASSALLDDHDNDGYHREFRIRFDADASFSDTLVYARLYLRRLGAADWVLYHTTEEFWISGSTNDDEYFVATTLDDGFPTDDYDVLIDLYESGYSGIVATIGPNDAPGLGLLPLEEAGLDAPIEIAGYSLRDVTTTLLIDDDADGHYSRFRVRFDPDADFPGGVAYARIWVRAEGGEWIEEHVTDNFVVDASGDADAYAFTADWLEGYPTAYYDVQIDLYDASTNLLAATAGSERPELALVPLEDAARDVRPNPPTSGGGTGDTHSREHGGGAWGLLWSALLLLVVGLRRMVARRAA